MANDPTPSANASLKPFRLLSAPVLLNASAETVTIVIAVSGYATGWVEFGTTAKLGQRADGLVDGLRPLHQRFLKFTLTDLQPGTRYFYRVVVSPIAFHHAYRINRQEPVATETFSFSTLNPAAEVASFTCWNDTHENRSTVGALANLLKGNPTDFLFWNGDVTNDITREEDLTDQFLNPCETPGTPFAASVPLFFGRGNHDVRGRDARSLSEMIAGPEGRYHYAFRQGPLACLVMDTGEDKPDHLPVYSGMVDFAAYRSEQARWLSSVIRQPWFREAPFRIAFLHIPLVWEAPVPEHWPEVWGIGIKGWICEDGYNKWHSLLVEGNVDAVISGHIHKHIVFQPNSARPYTQIIGGGPQPDRALAIIGRADMKKMQIDLQDLQGKIVESLLFSRRS